MFRASANSFVLFAVADAAIILCIVCLEFVQMYVSAGRRGVEDRQSALAFKQRSRYLDLQSSAHNTYSASSKHYFVA